MYCFKSSHLSGIAGAIILSLAPLTANAETACTVQTAKAATDVTELCECQTVTKGLLRYLQRSRNFGDVASELYSACPALATVLADFAPAATGGGPGDPGGSDGGNDSGGSGPAGGGPTGGGPTGGGPTGGGPTGGGPTGGGPTGGGPTGGGQNDPNGGSTSGGFD